VKLRALLFCPFFLVPRWVAGQTASLASEMPARAPVAPGVPTVRFRFDAGAPLLAPAGVAPDGAICVGTADGYIHSLGPDGSYRWSYSVHGAVTHRPLFAGQLWYIATSAERIYALTRAGALYWVFKPPSPIQSELALDSSGLLFFVAADHFLYGVTGHGGVSVRAPFGDAQSGPSTSPDGAIWAENRAGIRVRAHGQELRRLAPGAAPEFEFTAPDRMSDPEARVWQTLDDGVLRLSSASNARPSRIALTSAPLLTPAWSSAGRYAVVSARNGLVFAVEPPRARPSR
jgi:PQQ-like domain